MNSGIQHYLISKEEFLSQFLTRNGCDSVYSSDELLELGSIYLNKKRVSEDFTLSPGQYLRVHTNPKRFPRLQTEDISNRIIEENQGFLVFNKPGMLPCHPTLDNLLENSQHQLNNFLETEIYLTHRLDQATCGLILYAKNKQNQTKINLLFQNSNIEKHYYCLSKSKPKLGIHNHYIERSKRSPKVFNSLQTNATDQICTLEILESLPWNDYFCSKIRLMTGRTHQIRGQMAKMGCPILGDELYGGPTFDFFALQSSHLCFNLEGETYKYSLAPWEE
ncbi:MAG: pseudouridine synthase family protein [Bdellovibrionales bacterium]